MNMANDAELNPQELANIARTRAAFTSFLSVHFTTLPEAGFVERMRHGDLTAMLEAVVKDGNLPGAFLPKEGEATRSVLIYDDDHFYMGGVLAELLALRGCRVTLASPAPDISYWTQFTLEQERIQAGLMGLGVELITQHVLCSIAPDAVEIGHAVSGPRQVLPAEVVVLVTDRLPQNALYYELVPALEAGRLDSLRLIGDAEAPNIIAQAVFSGHLAAREFDEPPVDGTPFKVERITL